MYGDPVDIASFLRRPLVARVATNGPTPTLRPVWFIYEDEAFWWLTNTSTALAAAIQRGERLVVVVDTCDVATGEVVHVRARGTAEVIPLDRERAMRKFARYLGRDESRWDPRFVPSLDDPSTRMVRFQPTSMEAADVSFVVKPN
jgi:nitroimidazol reductase NimA-like FMN-containing flavoprotein (pyridoxamine 5'-phosphate oxidase superfamily)